MNQANRIFLDLNEAISLAINTIRLKSKRILFNIVYIVDKPGAGKTMMCDAMAKSNQMGFIAYSPALERIEKFGGIPEIYWENQETKDLRTVWSKPQMISEINALSDVNPNGVMVLLDDWHLCTEELQQIGFELFTYYSLNGHKLNNNVVFVLAGNESSAAGARVTLSAIRNRCTVIYTHSNVRYWLNNFAIPNQLHPCGISFFNAETNWDVFQEEESVNEQFGSPRSWTSAFNLIQSVEEQGLDIRHIQSILQGSVSSAAAQRFMLHYEIFSKLDMNEIFGKSKWSFNGNPVDRYRLAMAVNNEFYNRFAAGDAKSGQVYVKFLDDILAKHPELGMMMVTSLKNIARNTERKYPGGLDILAKLITNGIMPKTLVEKLKTTSASTV